MLRWFGRVVLLRVLPRRLLPIFTVVEVAQLLRAARRQRAAARAAREGGADTPGGDPWRDAFDAHRARSDTAPDEP